MPMSQSDVELNFFVHEISEEKRRIAAVTADVAGVAVTAEATVAVDVTACVRFVLAFAPAGSTGEPMVNRGM